MFNEEYKGLFINGYTGRSECRVIFASGQHLITVKSYRAAQLAITKFLNIAGLKEA